MAKKKEKENWLKIGRGFAGWHANKDCCSSSGGSLEGYIEEAAEGCLVYDAEGTDFNTFAKLVISGPMVKFTLPAGQVERFSDEDRAAARRMLPGLSGGFDTVATLAQSITYCGLDYVALDVYEALLRAVPGMKVGHVVKGKIVWESEVNE
jgi:hypothetical protein